MRGRRPGQEAPVVLTHARLMLFLPVTEPSGPFTNGRPRLPTPDVNKELIQQMYLHIQMDWLKTTNKTLLGQIKGS
ncbi:hypothetical protein EYF80_062193 [Liparis tanakae]|uniref:Uncharacterized protein n=1 Tax=Liparis tanakae TaxID=230148 RepID=A0A4Z2EH81_9TELE|nr:hypothetical protein EYF80_062193 [Liparis tanakae]